MTVSPQSASLTHNYLVLSPFIIEHNLFKPQSDVLEQAL